MPPEPSPSPDFEHVETWVFDLDNTLYPAACNLFAQIDERMRAFVSRHLGVDDEAARTLQKDYYRDYGTTLNGLMARDGIDPLAYLEFVHDIDLTAITPDPALGAAIARLPGRRIVFTNGSIAHAERVLGRLGLEAHFEGIIDIVATGYRPKPFREAFDHLVAATALEPARAAMFEDLARNLLPAHTLGMTTVWLRNDAPWSRQGPQDPPDQDHIHHVTEDLTQFLSQIRLRTPA
ncbi:MAG: pyrimidine 5'-nucleotidase [Alphaproteobacteria bacterium]|nr:pyrimidine 5'-nucleotidase [Alphaproteobacteria bacterium]